MILLDTDTLTHLHLGHEVVLQRLKSRSELEIGTTIISKIEILRGRFEFLMKAEGTEQFLKAQSLLDRSEFFLSSLLVVPLDQKSCEQFARLRVMPKLKKIGRADLLVASIALSKQAILVTRNHRHFQQIPQLDIENWVD